MIGVQYQDPVHSSHLYRVQDEVPVGHAKQHLHEVARVIVLVARIALRPTDTVGVARGGDRRHLGHEPDRGIEALFGIPDIHIVVIKSRQRADHAYHDCHRVGIAAKAAIETDHLLMQQIMLAHGLAERGLLDGRRQLPEHEQIGHLKKVALLGQLLDGITAIRQDARIPIHEGDSALAGCRRAIPGVIGQKPVTGIEGLDVDGLWAERPLEHRQAPVLRLRSYDRIHIFHHNPPSSLAGI